MKKLLFILSSLVILIVSISGCKKDEEMVTNLIITTVDDTGTPVQGVTVDLYFSLSDWLNETSPVYESRESDVEGKITYIEIDTGTYYIDAYKEDLTNWEDGVIKSIVDGFENTTNIIVEETASSNISSASGKRWILEGYLINGEDSFPFIDDCKKDDTLTFYKGPGTGAHELSRGSLKCSTFQEDKIVGAWTLMNENKLLQLQFGNDIVNWNIDTLETDKLAIHYLDGGNLQNVIYIPVE